MSTPGPLAGDMRDTSARLWLLEQFVKFTRLSTSDALKQSHAVQCNNPSLSPPHSTHAADRHHAHLDEQSFEVEFADILTRARAADVVGIVSIGTTADSCRRVISAGRAA